MQETGNYYSLDFNVLQSTTFPTDNASVEYNTTERSFSDSDKNEYILPIWRQAMWCILYAVIVIIATGGNLIVIWIVMTNKRMRTVTNYFLLNLSVADAMVSTLNVTFNFVYMLNSNWPFGETYCKIIPFTAVLSICASVFSLMSISIDRYTAIITPLRPRMGKAATLNLALLTWILGVFLGMPSLLFYKTYVLEYPNGMKRTICYSEWPDGVSNESHYEFYFNLIFLVVTYLVPILLMSYTYSRIAIELWKSQGIGECTRLQVENIKSKRRVVKMMIVIVVIFAVCWLPYQLYFIVIWFFPDITNSDYIHETYLAIYWLAMSNSMYNPMIYCWMNTRFRRGFKQVLACFLCCQKYTKGPKRRSMFTSRRRSFSGSPPHDSISRNGTLRSSYIHDTQIELHPSSSTCVTYGQQNPYTADQWDETELREMSQNKQKNDKQRQPPMFTKETFLIRQRHS